MTGEAGTPQLDAGAMAALLGPAAAADALAAALRGGLDPESCPPALRDRRPRRR
ncbi:hypothetical protein ACFW2T_01775 [Streptomyces sp. NPDC058892]|uniref:hypothetical protein n=1 Tax=unclassified Streptomyces TaxID=2593676 RepID=UPI00367B1E53